ncbi:Oleuropein beta-glucosidase [Sesamum angolense]|uniref:Oleuropein beta-glucosidase n=1 Tax=Sesamum angolense TaxID=2727404 RepID=A0AAE1WP14_9LAMI|nr:Oleuropein beta-glucosidase [Sesamum angolense]
MSNNVPGAQVARYAGAKLTRHDFPPDFIFGGATSTYQVEGAYAQDGRSLSNWDVFSLQKPGKICGGTNGCFAIDHYNRFKEDVGLMKKLGLDAYRFSISWSRVLPGGRLSGGVNKEGIKFYNDLIDSLLAQVTFTKNGYVDGSFPPAHGSTSAQPLAHNPVGFRCARGLDNTCYGGDAGTEPYIVAHHLILAHAVAVDIYKKNYKDVQDGEIGVTNMSGWFEPFSNAQADIDAASRAVDFMWDAPLVTGDYPPVMRQRVGERLPRFTPEQARLVQGSYDFIGMNYYTTYWAAYKPTPPGTPPTYTTDQELEFLMERDGVPIGEQAGSDWLYIVPHGIRELLLHTKNVYNNPIVYITENGVNEKNDWKKTIASALKDDHRIRYHQDHLAFSKEAMDLGAQLKGYFAWSLFDNYEWAEGYTVRFGMYYVDYVNGYARYPKKSAIWYMNFLNKRILPRPKRQVEEIEDDNSIAKRKKGR